MKTKLLPAMLAAMALVAVACGSAINAADDTTEAPPNTEVTAVDQSMTEEEGAMVEEAMSAHTITFDTTGWPELANGVHYEGWLIIDGTPVSTGNFNVVDGEIVDLEGSAVDYFAVDVDTSAATAVVISIEPADDTDPGPAATHFVAGDLVDGVADLTIDHAAALGTDFADATGSFVLATPSTEASDDELSGVWFITVPGPEAALSLPELPEGWVYEGWAVVDGTPVSTGTFTDGTGADASGIYSGPGGTPGYPGEDFVLNAPDGLTFPTDLSGATIVVSVEPAPDDSPAPFALKPLVGQVPADAEPLPVSYGLDNNAGTLPTGIATLS